jgi:spermidine synthase
MTPSQRIPRSWFYVLFVLSGFAGLIYESIWSHYLKLFLGHAAYAQTLVLAIFMGGMALGSWLCSRYSGRWRNLLLGYAAAEGAIGLCALAFHKVFIGATDLAYDSILPTLGSPLAVGAFKWILSSLLILPQSALLGMTFPLMSAGLVRAYPGGSGGTIAMLYFTNSLGAAAGVLASGFLLVSLVGLPGTMLTAGIMNVALALLVWGIVKYMDVPPPAPQERSRRAAGRVAGYGLMLAVAALTGAASFIYEIGWIRMLSMVLGSSTHAFELMLSAFILGLAFGGLWMKRRIDSLASPERFLGIVQVAMGLLALATLLVYGKTFELMRWMLGVLVRNESGHAVFNLGSHLIAMLVMFPAAFCAGMTLPLITHCLLKRGAGEGAIGAVYAANTMGAIIGVFAAVHIGMPGLGLKGMISAGAMIDVALGLLLLWWSARGTRLTAYAAAIGLAGVAATLAFVQLDPHKMASGVYRHGGLLTQKDAQILYHRDGKTATVNLVKTPGRVSVHTNGKPDAALNLEPRGPIAPDETTMVLTGALPLALHPQARTVANIGFGSGLTTHVLLASETITAVDTIEIEAAMVEAARGFSPRNDAAYRDERSRIHIEDAKTFFSAHNRRYDIITSEPSNPWVSGVSSLFTDEFYRRVKRYLNSDGVFVQWLQLYEINTPLVASVFKALSLHFTDYVIYTTGTDIIIVARNGALPHTPSDAIFRQPRLARELERVLIRNVDDLQLHRVGTRRAIQPYFDGIAVAANSDFFPVLDLNAAKARFMNADALDVIQLASASIPALEMLGGDLARGSISEAHRPWLRKGVQVRTALAARAYLLDGDRKHLAEIPPMLRSELELTRLLAIECRHPRSAVGVDHLRAVAETMVPFLTRDEFAPVWERLRASPCLARADGRQREWVALLAAVSGRNAAEMARIAEALLKEESGAPDAGRKDYLLFAAVTGRLALSERDRAVALWREHRGSTNRVPGDLLAGLLQAHLLMPTEGPATPSIRPK